VGEERGKGRKYNVRPLTIKESLKKRDVTKCDPASPVQDMLDSPHYFDTSYT
jgi:hypothetical protein